MYILHTYILYIYIIFHILFYLLIEALSLCTNVFSNPKRNIYLLLIMKYVAQLDNVLRFYQT